MNTLLLRILVKLDSIAIRNYLLVDQTIEGKTTNKRI